MSATDLTDFDLHLFGEGNHHHIHAKLGAHSKLEALTIAARRGLVELK